MVLLSAEAEKPVLACKPPFSSHQKQDNDRLIPALGLAAEERGLGFSLWLLQLPPGGGRAEAGSV